MRQKLRKAKSVLSEERAIGLLGRIQHHQLKLGGQLHKGVTMLTEEQSELLDVLGAEKPALS